LVFVVDLIVFVASGLACSADLLADLFLVLKFGRSLLKIRKAVALQGKR
jgi:hypothetical protein